MNFTTDGATLPLFFRRWIRKNYALTVLFRIDQAGVFHDMLVWQFRDRVALNRRLFIKELHKLDVPVELIWMINLGLWIFDISPAWLQVKMQEAAR